MRYPVPEKLRQSAWINREKYQQLYQQSIDNPEAFWAEQAQIIDWFQPFTKVKETSFSLDDFHIRWFADGVLNVSYNCLDRHLKTHGHKTAIIWEGDEPHLSQKITFHELYRQVCQFANCLKSLGVKKGDFVSLYLPMMIEAAVAMLACARIGAVHSVVFGGFSPESLANRIMDCHAKVVITADEGFRGGRVLPYKNNCDMALHNAGITSVEHVIVIKRGSGNVPWKNGRDIWFHEIMEKASPDCAPEPMQAEDPFFVLYTSGSTAKPKGVLHTTGGYLVYAALTHRYVFDYHENDMYWCTADIGWITGHSYVVYGPLANGATTLMFEGIPTYPDPSRYWQIIDQHAVSIFYTAPTAIRSLMRFGEAPVMNTSRQSLRILGSVGEPINHEAWEWYYKVVGQERCPIMDTWWQTETGGILIAPLPGATALKPASVTLPFFGVKPAILEETTGLSCTGLAQGSLVITDSWPGQARTILNDHQRFLDTYFSTSPGHYFTGDGARRDEEGYYWITGRIDDVMNVSGHRISTAEVENALDTHPLVVEAAVVGFPHAIKGQGIYAFVTLRDDEALSPYIIQELQETVRRQIGPIAVPDYIQWAPQLPKTRSGKILRRILRKIAAGDYDNIGDTSTLAEPDVVTDLINNSPRQQGLTNMPHAKP